MSELYNYEYYHNGCGPVPYEDPEIWIKHFEEYADRIVADLHPVSVLDAGCAMGYLVAALRDRGVEAYGLDISEYAISMVREDIRPYCAVGSLLDSLPEDFPKQFDLITNIEVLEHIYEEDGKKAIENLCRVTDCILFSSSPDDLTEATHVNVQQPEYWVKQFAQFGFYNRIDYDPSYIAPWAMLFQRTSNMIRVVENYQRKCRLLRCSYENEQRTSGKLAKDVEILREQQATDERYFRGEIARLTTEVHEHMEALKQSSSEAYQYAEQLKTAQEQVICLQNSDKEKSVAISDLEEQLTGKNAAIIDLEQQLTGKNAAIIDLEEQLTGKNAAIIDLEQETQKQAANNMALKKQLEEINSFCVQLQREQNAHLQELALLQSQLQNITQSRGYKVLCVYCRIRDWLLPKGSRRREFVKRLARIIFPKAEPTAPTEETADEPTQESAPFYSAEEVARQNWCREHPVQSDIKFSILVPVFNTPIPVLQAMIFSVKDQIYTNWELCIVDASPDQDDIRYLVEQLSLDCDKIKYKKLDSNRGISGNTNEALQMATGDFIALLDHDDIIAPNALYEYAAALLEDPDTDFFYSDKDMINESGTERMNPLYKPEFSPDIMFSANYLTHFCAIRASILRQIGGFDSDTDGAQDWDIFLKVMECTARIQRIERVLYHWRIIPSSVASGIGAKPYALDAQLCALRNYIAHKEWAGEVYFANRQESHIKVDWHFKEQPDVALISVSVDGTRTATVDGCAEYFSLSWGDSDWMDVIRKSRADVLLFVDADACLSYSEQLPTELAAWALHPEIGFASPQLRAEDKIVSCGLVYENGQIMDMYGGHAVGFYGQMGHSEWYRNFSCFRGVCLAVERQKFLSFCTYDLRFGAFALSFNCFAALKLGMRNIYDHYAWVTVAADRLSSADDLSRDFEHLMQAIEIPSKDPYFNTHCTIDVNRKFPVQRVQADAAPEHLDKYTTDALALAAIFDFTNKDLDRNRVSLCKKYDGGVQSMVWFLQEFDYVFYAGLYTIFRTASYLQREHGIQHTFVFISGVSADVMMERIGAGFPELRGCRAYSITSPEELFGIPSADAAICTLWTTAYYLLKFNKVHRKFYFIQDYEPLFYPAGSTYAQAEATYRFGFYGIANTLGLKNVYESEYGGKAVSLDPSIDTSIFYPNPQRQYQKKQYTVFFYGRPGHPRNGFELGVEALKVLKRKMGNRVRIVTAGANYNISAYGLDGIVENLGRLKVDETGDLYRECDAGLIMMYTRHPSYLPYELMACGCCVISNYNAYTTWFLKDGENAAVCEPSASSIASTVESILLDETRRKSIAEQGAQQILSQNPSWNESLEKVARFIQNPEGIESV